ncbi:UNVERIFIED_CONTAM: hypothetical protein PYX00_000306 [Menopon gallinae]|uniref:Ig-like domain-containing protein n=1 Tax=Menopon gallinae TaxID=328185 RepID=A0AAW2I8M6_9NEOP
MYRFQIGLLFTLLIRLCFSRLGEIPFDRPLGVKEIFNKNDKTVKMYPPRDDLEYPGTDELKLLKVADLWDTYYKCLSKKMDDYKKVKPIIIQIMEGQFTSMKCPICVRPFEGYEHIEWRYKPLTSNTNDPEEPEYLDLTPEMILTRKKTLKIYNAMVGYSGLYICYYGSNPVSIYILEVKDQDIVTLREPPKGNDTIELPDKTNMTVYYSWSEWTECSECETVGKKFKYGICMAMAEDNEKDKPVVPAAFAGEWRRRRKRRRRLQKKRQDYYPDTAVLYMEKTNVVPNILRKFGTGIPCSSHILPEAYKSLVMQLEIPPALAIVELCKVSCPDSIIFETLDRKGRIIERVNNTAGIFSADQALPLLPPQVERLTKIVEFGTDIILQCPGNLLANIPIKWMIDKATVIPEIATNISEGRLSIDILNKLHISHLRLIDSRTYSCWQRGKLVGTVRVAVIKNLRLAFDHHVLLLTMLSIASSILYVGIKVIKREIIMKKRAKLTT